MEDKIGARLASQPRANENLYQTVQSSVHIAPNLMPTRAQPPLNIPTTQELKAKNKEGMPYSLLFDHGIKEVTPEVSFIIHLQVTH